MMKIRLYHLGGDPTTQVVQRELEALQKELPHRLTQVDVSLEPAVAERLGEGLPAIEVGPYFLRWPFSPTEIRVTLSAASQNPKAQISSARPSVVRRARGAQHAVLAVARNWLVGVNLFVFGMLGLPFLAPVLMKAGVTEPAGWIYTLYSPMCHQFAFRSWFLFGSSAAYSRAAAGVGGIPFVEATRISDFDLSAARAFRGNEELGYKVAFCQRDDAMYGGILLAGLAYSLGGRRWAPFPTWAWLAFGIAPIALDGGTQLLGGWGWLPGPARESTPFLRTLTGAAFGMLTVWFAYPQVEQNMAETRALLRAELTEDAPRS